MTIKDGTASYNAWVETPMPVYTKFYFFDMLNPRDLFHNHEKPILEERGPYTFRYVYYFYPKPKVLCNTQFLLLKGNSEKSQYPVAPKWYSDLQKSEILVF